MSFFLLPSGTLMTMVNVISLGNHLTSALLICQGTKTVFVSSGNSCSLEHAESRKRSSTEATRAEKNRNVLFPKWSRRCYTQRDAADAADGCISSLKAGSRIYAYEHAKSFSTARMSKPQQAAEPTPTVTCWTPTTGARPTVEHVTWSFPSFHNLRNRYLQPHITSLQE